MSRDLRRTRRVRRREAPDNPVRIYNSKIRLLEAGHTQNRGLFTDFSNVRNNCNLTPVIEIIKSLVGDMKYFVLIIALSLSSVAHSSKCVALTSYDLFSIYYMNKSHPSVKSVEVVGTNGLSWPD